MVQVCQEFNLILDSGNKKKVDLIKKNKGLIKELIGKGYSVLISEKEIFGIPILSILLKIKKETTHKISFGEIKSFFFETIKRNGLSELSFQTGDQYWY